MAVQVSNPEKEPGREISIAGRGPDPSRLTLIQVCGLAFLALLIYAFLGQRTFYREDGYQLIHHMLGKGLLYHDIHPLYLPVLDLATRLLAWMGRGAHGTGTLLSAASVAGAILFLGLMARRSLPGRRAQLLFLGLVALCPAVSFFATVVEFHGLFFLFVGLGFYLAEDLIQATSTRKALTCALLLGLATSLGTAAHATGQLLLPLFWAWVIARRAGWDRWPALLLFSGTHLLLYFGGLALILYLLGIGGQSQAAGSLGHLERWLHQGLATALARFPGQLWWEIVFPYLPLSLLPLLLLLPRSMRARPCRLQLLCAIAMFLPYLLLVVLTLADEYSGEAIWERGAYLLPLAPALAWGLARSRLPAPLLGSLLLVGALVSLAQIYEHDQRPGRAFAAEVESISQGKQVLLFTSPVESSYVALELPEAMQIPILEYLATPSSMRAGQMAVADRLLSRLRAEGRRIFLSAEARALMQGSREGEIGERLAEMEVANPTLHAWVVENGRAWLAHLEKNWNLSVVPEHPAFYEILAR